MNGTRSVLVTAVALAAACGYSSPYVPPPDGRPRAVWHEDHVVVETAGAPLSSGCMQELGWLSHTDRLRLATGTLRITQPMVAPPVAFAIVAGAFWVPRFYGPPILVPAPGVAPLLPRPPLFLPPPLLRVPAPAPLGLRPSGTSGGVPSVDDERALEVLAAIALVVLPAVAVGLALSRPEDSDANAQAIDQVNAYNDLLRSAGSPCAVGPS